MISSPAPWQKPGQPDPESSVHILGGRNLWPISLGEATRWDADWQRLLFRVLLPVSTLVQFGVDPIALTDPDHRPVARLASGDEGHCCRLELRHRADAADALFEMELADTAFNQIEVTWIAIQDPCSPRFDVDVLPDGQPTLRGVLHRNLAAEQAALAAGLAPGQIRRGLRRFSSYAGRMESFMACLNQREYIAQPLYYHTAVLFERIGFTYVQGQARMEQIDRDFAAGGALRKRMDGSTPFRQPELADHVRGRAWAIHDGVLDPPWDRVRMVKRLGVNAGIGTCPGVPW